MSVHREINVDPDEVLTQFTNPLRKILLNELKLSIIYS